MAHTAESWGLSGGEDSLLAVTTFCFLEFGSFQCTQYPTGCREVLYKCSYLPQPHIWKPRLCLAPKSRPAQALPTHLGLLTPRRLASASSKVIADESTTGTRGVHCLYSFQIKRSAVTLDSSQDLPRELECGVRRGAEDEQQPGLTLELWRFCRASHYR